MSTKHVSSAMFFILADGEVHTFEEIFERTRILVEPSRAVRTYANTINCGRATLQEKKGTLRNTSKRRVVITRKPLVEPEQVDVPTAVKFVVKRTLRCLAKNGFVIHDENQWLLSDEGRQHIRLKLVASNIAAMVKSSLMLRGKLI